MTSSAINARSAAQTRVRWELLANLVRKDLKVKYKNSALGFAWSLATPLVLMAVYYVVFQVILGGGIPDFAIYLMSGLLIWTAFQGTVTSSTGAVVGNAGLVKKVPFPHAILPLASVGFAAVHFVLQFAVLLIVTPFLHGFSFVGPQFLLIVPALVVAATFTVGLAYLVSSLNVRYRDIEHLVEVAMLGWFFLNPIVYPAGLVHKELGHWFPLYFLNPMAAVVATFQRAVYARPFVAGGTTTLAARGYLPYLEYLGIGMAVSIVVLAVGYRTFNRMSADFAEEL